VWAALLTVYLVWGSTYLAIREAVATMPPFLMASARFTTAGGILYAFSVRRGDRSADPLGRRQWVAAAIAGGLLLVGGNGSVVWAEQHVPSGIAALVVATIPLWMVIIGVAVFRERISALEIMGVVIGFAGIVVLVGLPGSGRLNLAGVLALVFAAASWATGSLYSRRAPLPTRPLVSTAMQMLAAGAFLLVAGAVTGEFGRLDLSAISLSSWLGLGWLIVFGSIVAFTAYVWLLRNARISLISTYAYVNPIVAVFLGWLLLSEPITLRTLLAGALILAAVAIIVTAASRSRPEGARAEAH